MAGEEVALIDALEADVLPVATSAAIPPENVDAFAKEVSHLLGKFEVEAQFDRVRRQYEHVIDGLLKATTKMISAIERLRKHHETSAAQEVIGDHSPGAYLEPWPLEVRSLTKRPHPLADLKRRISDLHKQAESISTAKLPRRNKNRTSNRTCMLLHNIWVTARKFGGDLTFNKHAAHGNRGTLEEVVDYLDSAQKGNPPLFFMPGWKIPSASTLERLRPRRQLHPHERKIF
jgi:hypothetical protein